MIEINKNPSRKELLWFGALFALFFGIVGTLVVWRFQAPVVAYSIWGVAATVVVLYYLIPGMRKPLYLGWMYAAFPIGWTVSHIIMGATYYLLVTPVGLLMRLVGYDPMHRRLEPAAKSYWIPRTQNQDRSRYFRQF